MRLKSLHPVLSPESGGVRGQSETLGFVLLFGIVVFGGVTVISIGSLAVSDTQEQFTTDRAENTLTQLASDGALVALGGADSQELSLPDTDGETYAVDETAGRMTVEYTDDNNSEQIANVTLGEIRYEADDGTVISYQGGGVWRTSENGGSTMVSPPEFNYRAATLTLPIITIGDTGQIGDGTQLKQQSQSPIFPPGNNITNPLRQGQVNVTVTSQYYQAWGSYFEERTVGGVSYDDANNSVTVQLVVPFEESFNSAVAVTGDGPNAIKINGGPDGPPSDWRTGADYPSVDSTIEQQIDDCSSGSCDDLTDNTIDDSGTYYKNKSYDGDITVDDPDGNVSIVIDGDLDDSDISIDELSGENTVDIFVRGDFTIGKTINSDGDATDLSVFVHSDGDVESNGKTTYNGVLYAPGSTCTLNGSPAKDFDTAFVCESITMNGNYKESMQYNKELADNGFPVQTDDISVLRYVHVSEYKIGLSSD